MVNQLLLLITFAFKIFDLCTWLRHTLTDAYLYWCGTLRINNNNDRLIRIKGLWCRGSGEPRAGADLQSKSSTLTPQICEQEKNPQGFLDFGGVQKNPDDEKISSEIFAVRVVIRPRAREEFHRNSSNSESSSGLEGEGVIRQNHSETHKLNMGRKCPGKGYDLVEELLRNSSSPRGLTTTRISKVG